MPERTPAAGFDAAEAAVFDAVLERFAVVYPAIAAGVAAELPSAVVVGRVPAVSVVAVVVALVVVVTMSHSDLGLPGRAARLHPAPAGPYAQCETR